MVTSGLFCVLTTLARPSKILFLATLGGMLLQRLKPNIMENSHAENFDGQMVYAQNKRQQVSECRWTATQIVSC